MWRDGEARVAFYWRARARRGLGAVRGLGSERARHWSRARASTAWCGGKRGEGAAVLLADHGRGGVARRALAVAWRGCMQRVGCAAVLGSLRAGAERRGGVSSRAWRRVAASSASSAERPRTAARGVASWTVSTPACLAVLGSLRPEVEGRGRGVEHGAASPLRRVLAHHGDDPCGSAPRAASAWRTPHSTPGQRTRFQLDSSRG